MANIMKKKAVMRKLISCNLFRPMRSAMNMVQIYPGSEMSCGR